MEVEDIAIELCMEDDNAPFYMGIGRSKNRIRKADVLK